MRKNFLFMLVLAALAITSMVCATCSRLEDNNPETLQEFDNPFDFVGYNHNNGLDYIIQNFPRSGLNKKDVQDTILEVYSLLNEYVSALPPGSILHNDFLDRKAIEKRVSNIFLNSDALKSSADKLSAKQTVYIQRFKNILKQNPESDSIRVFTLISTLEKEIWESNLSENDKFVLLIATSVGKHSWKYWTYEKLSKSWTHESKNEVWPDWQKLKEAVVEADILGAIGGAIGGCITGAIIGTVILPGVGTITACVLEAVTVGFEAAVISSTIAAIKFLIFE